jgi:uncharacterized damage-inducible protein DinB
MTLDDLRTLVDYHYWARDRVLDAAEALTPEQLNKDLGSSFRTVRETLVHLYSAEWAWYSRWQGTSPTSMLSIDLFPDIPTLRTRWQENERNVRTFLEGLGEAGIAREFEYNTLAGEPGRSVFWQMLQHVVNHGSYHRGQVTTMMRQLGAEPSKSMDLIRFHRIRDARQGAGV